MSDLSKYKDTYQNYPKLSVKLLWHSGYWDGPLSGMCMFEGEKYWFEHIDEWLNHNDYPEDMDDFEMPWYRRYLIWKLPESEQALIEINHLKFVNMVGSHTTYDDNGIRSYFHYNDKITKETVDRFYEEAKLQEPISITIKDEYIIGWFER